MAYSVVLNYLVTTLCLMVVATLNEANQHHFRPKNSHYGKETNRRDYCVYQGSFESDSLSSDMSYLCLLENDVKHCVQLLQKLEQKKFKEFGCCSIIKKRCKHEVNCKFSGVCSSTRPCPPSQTLLVDFARDSETRSVMASPEPTQSPSDKPT